MTKEPLRLRMKIWTDPQSGQRYLMATAYMVPNGRPISDAMRGYAMRDDDTKLVDLTIDEWNALPFYYFAEDGEAPRKIERSLDVRR